MWAQGEALPSPAAKGLQLLPSRHPDHLCPLAGPGVGQPEVHMGPASSQGCWVLGETHCRAIFRSSPAGPEATPASRAAPESCRVEAPLPLHLHYPPGPGYRSWVPLDDPHGPRQIEGGLGKKPGGNLPESQPTDGLLAARCSPARGCGAIKRRPNLLILISGASACSSVDGGLGSQPETEAGSWRWKRQIPATRPGVSDEALPSALQKEFPQRRKAVK